MVLSFSRPEPFTWPYVQPRELLAIYPPRESLPPPALPSPPRKPTFDALFSLSTHLIPACYLRSTRDVPVPGPPPATMTKLERGTYFKKLTQDLKDWRLSTNPTGLPKILWNCLNRYKRIKGGFRPNGITLFFAHANGFPKEIWEPMLAHLLSSPAGELINEVWCWESVQHGDAMIVNEQALSAVFDWADNTRDILNFLLNFLPPSSEVPLPIHLPQLSAEESERRRSLGLVDRKLVAIGHSYGGCTSALAAISFPKLFSSLVLVDPVIVEPVDKGVRIADELTFGALMRREVDEALSLFQQSPFFKAWDPAVLQVYVECGLFSTKDSDGQDVVRLKMPGIQEAIVFSETHTELEAWQQLPSLDERISLRWLLPAKPGAPEFGPPGAQQRRAWLRPANSSNIRIPSAGHLIPQESPKELASDLRDFILRQYSPSKDGVRCLL
ncbi:hypothetical protein BDN72DRAFT_935522 [Pluteus cervinus]|uniref:Uncharacterized protein n=1 Tax=Pluteus cervinus TaxID=181527 RepID=A0ACD3BC76_9AGAR|nr:hypothetical protein BDN72DRAFT_935522 [Pluteus cervinus]